MKRDAVLILPGGHSRATSRRYRFAADAYARRGIDPIPVDIDWTRARTPHDFAHQTLQTARSVDADHARLHTRC